MNDNGNTNRFIPNMNDNQNNNMTQLENTNTLNVLPTQNMVNTPVSNVPNNEVNINPVAQSNINTPDNINNLANPMPDDNRFINTGNSVVDMNNNTALNDMNVDGTYHNFENPPAYTNDPEVRQNIENAKKNTVPISKELKLIIIISVIMLVFIFVMPTIFDFLRNIKYR